MTDGGHIRLLSSDVANKIAAGEVVERPASVLKELLENALDAGATQLDIDVVAGGTRLISVADNGSGMNRDDALLSVERHATSKIRTAADIAHIRTLGFRGEALAAISSVARFRLQTRRAADLAGTELLMSGGKLQDVRETGCPPGTAIEVRDLFFNVPARRKFLRSPQTESTHIRHTFIVHALAWPEIGMKLAMDGRVVWALPAGAGLADRIRELFGADVHGGLRPASFRGDDFGVTGFVSVPSLTRGDRSEQYVFVNRRPATAAVVVRAIGEGYHALAASDRHPYVFLFIELPHDRVDVNVHPTKREVRFQRPAEIREAIVSAIRAGLAERTGTLADVVAGPVAVPAAATPSTPPQPQLRIDDLPPMRRFAYPHMPPRELPRGDAGPGKEFRSASPVPVVPVAAGTPASAESAALPTPHSPWEWCRVVGQIGGLYVVLETDDGFVVMDPHAAHERVLYEKFMADVARSRVESQGLLVPETVELLPRDANHVRKNLELLRKMGIGVSEFGGDTFVVDALPTALTGLKAQDMLVEVARNLELLGERGGGARWREEAVAQAACKAAVKARDRLSLAELEELVVALASAEMPYTCPHGRPTLIYTSFAELSRKFGRG